MRHKWDSKVGTSVDDNIAKCIKCGTLKQTICGKVAYFRDDISLDWAGNCDERILKGYVEDDFVPKPSKSGGVY
jgi:hypothetical protein